MKFSNCKIANFLLFAALAAVAAAPAAAATPNVQVQVADFCNGCDPANRFVQLTPNATAGQIDPAKLRGLSDSSGQITFSNVPAGFYSLSIAGAGVESQLIKVPNQSGTVSASGSPVVAGLSRPQAITAVAAGTNVTVQTNGPLATINSSGGGGGDTVWTNDGTLLYPQSQVTQLAWLSDKSTNGPSTVQIVNGVQSDPNGTTYGTASLQSGAPNTADLAYGQLFLDAAGSNGVERQVFIWAAPNSTKPLIDFLELPSTHLFTVNSNGLTYANSYTIAATTNQITFGATNTAPATTSAVFWASCKVSGLTNEFRLMLVAP